MFKLYLYGHPCKSFVKVGSLRNHSRSEFLFPLKRTALNLVHVSRTFSIETISRQYLSTGPYRNLSFLCSSPSLYLFSLHLQSIQFEMGGKVNGIRSSSPVHNIIKHNDGNGVKCFVFIEFCYGQILECQDFQT